MKNKKLCRRLAFIFIVVASSGYALYVIGERIKAGALEREDYFASVYYSIIDYYNENGKFPSGIDDAKVFPLAHSLTKVFGEGLEYHSATDEDFSLREKSSHWVSLFKRDQLIATSDKVACWSSGKKLSRFTSPASP